MLQITYQAQLPKGKYKSLSYAILFARALYAELSVRLPVQRIVRLSPSIGHAGRPERVCQTMPETSRADLIMRGKPKRENHTLSNSVFFPDQSDHPHTPVLLIPYGYRFKDINNMLFTSNSEGLMDLPLTHQLAATFCPRAFQLDGSQIKHMHWNNVSLLPKTGSKQQHPLPDLVNEQIRKMKIDLLVMPLPVRSMTSVPAWQQQMITGTDTPILLVPKAATQAADNRLSEIELGN